MHIVVNDEIHLTEARLTDRAAMAHWLNDRAVADPLLTVPYPYTERDADEFLARVVQEQTVFLAVRDAGGELIGGTGFKDFVPGVSHRAEIGYWMARPLWGRGHMTAVVRAACAYAIAEFGLVKISAHVFAGNEASARVLEKCGFEREGYLRRHYRKDGRLIDAVAYGLLA